MSKNDEKIIMCKPDIFEMTYEPIDHVNNDVKKIEFTVEKAEKMK